MLGLSYKVTASPPHLHSILYKEVTIQSLYLKSGKLSSTCLRVSIYINYFEFLYMGHLSIFFFQFSKLKIFLAGKVGFISLCAHMISLFDAIDIAFSSNSIITVHCRYTRNCLGLLTLYPTILWYLIISFRK